MNKNENDIQIETKENETEITPSSPKSDRIQTQSPITYSPRKANAAMLLGKTSKRKQLSNSNLTHHLNESNETDHSSSSNELTPHQLSKSNECESSQSSTSMKSSITSSM